HKIACDNHQGAYDAVNHFLESGCKRIAFLGGAPHLSNVQERYNGYKEALEHAGIALNDSYIKFCNHAGLVQDELDTAIRNIMKAESKPDAILICGDTLTASSLRFFQKNNIKIPDDIAVVGFSNQDFAEFLNPALTT